MNSKQKHTLAHVRTTLQMSALALATTLSISATAAESEEWNYDLTIYGLASSMTGEVTIGDYVGDVNLPFSEVLENLELAAMGSFRIGKGNWAFTTDLIFAGLGTSTERLSVDLDQLILSPTLSYRINERFTLLAGARYNDIRTHLTRLGINPAPETLTADQSWWDPIVGIDATMPISQGWAFTFQGDIGGGLSGSDLTWQAFPGIKWQFSENSALLGGYRWLYSDHETGSGDDYFRYDMTTEGFQLGLRFSY